MRHLKEYINESITITILAWISCAILGLLTLFSISLISKEVHQSFAGEGPMGGGEISDPKHLWANIKYQGLIWGFMEWLIEKIDYKKQESWWKNIDGICEKISKDEQFIVWAAQPVNKRKLKDLKPIIDNILSAKERNIVNTVTRILFDEWRNSINHPTIEKDMQKELNKI